MRGGHRQIEEKRKATLHRIGFVASPVNTSSRASEVPTSADNNRSERTDASSLSHITDPTLAAHKELDRDTATSVFNGRSARSFTMTCRIRDHLSRSLGAPRPARITGIFITNGECVSDVFPSWLRLAYQGGGNNYYPFDLNMPIRIPKRPLAHYVHDAPLTEHGKTTAALVGRGLRVEKIHPTRIYCAPELRSVQTASEVARELKACNTCICMEPALMEWAGWRETAASIDFLTPKQCRYLGYQIDFGYVPKMTVVEVMEVTKGPFGEDRCESPNEYHERLSNFVIQVMNETERGSVAFVGSSHVLHVAMDGLWRNATELRSVGLTINPCTTGKIEIMPNGQVCFNDTPIRHLTSTLHDALVLEEKDQKREVFENGRR